MTAAKRSGARRGPSFSAAPSLARVVCSEPQRDNALTLQPLTRQGLLLDDRAFRELAGDRLDGGNEPARPDDRDGLRTVHGGDIGCYPLATRHCRNGHAGLQESRLRRFKRIKDTGGR